MNFISSLLPWSSPIWTVAMCTTWSYPWRLSRSYYCAEYSSISNVRHPKEGTCNTSAKHAALGASLLLALIQGVGYQIYILHGMGPGYLRKHVIPILSTHFTQSSSDSVLQTLSAKQFAVALAPWDILPSEVSPPTHTSYLPEKHQDMTLPTGMGVEVWRATLKVVGGLRGLPLSFKTFLTSVILNFFTLYLIVFLTMSLYMGYICRAPRVT